MPNMPCGFEINYVHSLQSLKDEFRFPSYVGRKEKQLDVQTRIWSCLIQSLQERVLEFENIHNWHQDVKFVCLLVAYRPSNMRVYLRDGSAQTILRAATLR